MPRIITITSGKGGVGKTNVTTNLAVHLAARGHKTCIFDADLGLANINILLNIQPEHTLSDVIRKNIALEDIIVRDCHGIDIIPGSSGIEEIVHLDPDRLNRLISAFSDLNSYDFLFFDTAAGISSDIISFCLSSNEVIIIITPEPTSLTDAYALLKVLTGHGFAGKARIIVNQCKDTAIAKKTYTGFKDVVMKYLSINIQPLGVILADPNIAESVRRQQPFVDIFPDTTATKCIKAISRNLTENIGADLDVPDTQSFWKRCLNNLRSGLAPAHPPPPAAEDKNLKPMLPAEPVTVSPEPPPAPEPEPLAAETTAEDSTDKTVVSTETAPSNLRFLMQQLIEGINGISGEISSLREALANNTPVPPRSDDTGTVTDQSRTPEKIILDFDAFLKKP